MVGETGQEGHRPYVSAAQREAASWVLTGQYLRSPAVIRELLSVRCPRCTVKRGAPPRFSRGRSQGD